MPTVARYVQETRVALTFGFGFLTLCAAVFFGIRQVSYVPQKVRVDHVNVLCHLGWGKNAHYDTELTEDCQALRLSWKTDPKYRGFHFRRETYVYFQYFSPADDRLHAGRLVRSFNESGQPVGIGDRINIRVSRINPQHYTD